MMRLLIISWHFPPVNSIAAVRVSKFGQYMHEAGHEVRVITAEKQENDSSLSLGIPDSLIVTSSWFDIDRIAHPLASRSRTANGPVVDQLSVPGRLRDILQSWRSRFASTYNGVFFFPDRRIGWVPALLRAVDLTVSQWRPDVIFVSGPPFSPFIAAALASRRIGVPWIAEFRDRWVDDPYFPPPRWRGRLDIWLERRLIGTAMAIVTVSDPWAQFYQQKFAKPTIAVYNGFDAIDLDAAGRIMPSEGTPANGPSLRILHMGSIYPGRRDPSALFEAVRLGKFSPDQVRIVFYGAATEVISSLARKMGVDEHVEIHPKVTYMQSLAIQRRADILLLMQWNNPRELGNIPAKMFEYFAARRPILGLGYEEGVPADIIHSRNAGMFSNDPPAIVQKLTEWLAVKQREGKIPDLPADVAYGLLRSEQFAKLDVWIRDLIAPAQTAVVGSLPTGAHPARNLIFSTQFRIADTSSLQRPVLCVVIDTEEDFVWTEPLRRTGYSLRSVDAQGRAQEIFDRWHVKPIYLIDYPVLKSPSCEQVFRGFYDSGRCELGIQLHPWVTPPFDEVLSPAMSYPCNLPRAIHARKLDTLASEFRSRFGFDPKVHKAGRFGFDEASAELLEEMGYDVDTSVVPFTTFENDGGPSFHGAPAVPFWFGGQRGVLELPTTCGIAGWVPSKIAGRIWPKIERSASQLYLRAMSARLRLVERIKLSPEGMDLPAMERLTRQLLANGHKVFSLSYHSSSLTPGGNPYVSSEADCIALLDRIDRYLRFFFENIGGGTTTVAELRQMLAAEPREFRMEPDLSPESSSRLG